MDAVKASETKWTRKFVAICPGTQPCSISIQDVEVQLNIVFWHL